MARQNCFETIIRIVASQILWILLRTPLKIVDCGNRVPNRNAEPTSLRHPPWRRSPRGGGHRASTVFVFTKKFAHAFPRCITCREKKTASEMRAARENTFCARRPPTNPNVNASIATRRHTVRPLWMGATSRGGQSRIACSSQARLPTRWAPRDGMSMGSA